MTTALDVSSPEREAPVDMSSEKPPQTYILHAVLIGVALVVVMVVLLMRAWG